MADLSPKTKLILVILAFVSAVPLIVYGIVNLVLVSTSNIPSWFMVFFGALIIMLILTLVFGVYSRPPHEEELEP